MGKSAQIFLHTWLPDAMEGPTPVSALIHAATMVTAGVFLVVRCSPIYEYSELILAFITIIGMTTAIFAASIALVQDDIKKLKDSEASKILATIQAEMSLINRK